MNSKEHRGPLGKAAVAALTCKASTPKFGTLRQEDSWELETNQSYMEKKNPVFKNNSKFFFKESKGKLWG